MKKWDFCGLLRSEGRGLSCLLEGKIRISWTRSSPESMYRFKSIDLCVYQITKCVYSSNWFPPESLSILISCVDCCDLIVFEAILRLLV